MDHGLYLHAVALFNRASFYDAHEAWEDVWRPSAEPERKFLQGLIQVAVAFHHHGNGNLAGARSLLERGHRNLSPYPADFGGIRLGALRESLEQWRRALDEGTPVPQLPQI